MDALTRRLVTDSLPFNKCVVTTATRQVWGELACSLRDGGLTAASRVIRELDPSSSLELGEVPAVSVDLHRERRFRFELPAALSAPLAATANLLATGQRSQSNLSDLLPTLARTSPNDWVFRVDDRFDDPPSEYRAYTTGGMWDAILFHSTPTVKQQRSAWAAVLDWSEDGPRQIDELSVDRSKDARVGPLPAQEAFQLLRDDADAFRAIGYAGCPFNARFGNAHDWVQVWFEGHATQVIVHDCHSATGYPPWDLENFFCFRALIISLASSLNARRFVWAVEADDTPETQARDISDVDDLDAMWSCFSELPDRHVGEAAFSTAFAEKRLSSR